MREIRRKNLGLYVLMIAVIILSCVFFIVIYNRIKDQSLELGNVINFVVDSERSSETLKCWYDESKKVYYVFLPTNAKTMKASCVEDVTVLVDGLPDNAKIDINELKMNHPYNFKVINDKKVYDSGILIFMKSKNISTLFITTDSGTMQYIDAQKGNAEKGSYNIWSTDESQVISGLLEELCGRGNTSWTQCQKKGYKLVLNQSESLLGLRASDTYVLVANARSNYLSNTIAFWLEEQIGVKNVTRSVPLDLYLNGEYAGSYILCERIYVGENGINITDLDEVNTQVNVGQNLEELEQYVSKDGSLKANLWRYEPNDITGGYLIERDVPEYYADEKSGFIISSGDHYVIKSPKYASRSEVEYIQSYMQEAYDAIVARDGCNPNTDLYYGEYIDMDSFALKYALEEFLAFNDAGRSSAYYYKDKEGALYAGPGWDFEGAFLGNSQYLTYLNGTMYSTDLYEKLWHHDDFQNLVIADYNDKLKPAVELLLSNKFDEMKTTVDASAAMDTIRWGREDFSNSCDEIKEWIINRCDFLDNHWNSNQNHITVKVKSDWENNAYIYINRGEKLNLDELPEYIRNDFDFAGWVDEETGELFDFNQEINSDLTLTALWIHHDIPIANLIIQKIQQIIPECCFIGAFFVVGTFFWVKIKRGGKKR